MSTFQCSRTRRRLTTLPHWYGRSNGKIGASCGSLAPEQKHIAGVARLAERIVEANRQVEKADVAAIAVQSERVSSDAVDESPGFLDLVATAEETLPS